MMGKTYADTFKQFNTYNSEREREEATRRQTYNLQIDLFRERARKYLEREMKRQETVGRQDITTHLMMMERQWCWDLEDSDEEEDTSEHWSFNKSGLVKWFSKFD